MSTEMSAEDAVSEDAALGGKLVLRQPLRGHRFGHDSILLAAATAAHPGEHAVELGAGVGAAGLALARRVEGLAVTLVEIDPQLAALAQENTERNGLARRVRSVCLDVAASAAAFAAAGLALASADRVLMNPPFNAPQNPSPHRGRRIARTASDATLALWLAHGGAAASSRGRGDADLARRRSCRGDCGAGNRIRRDRGVADPSQARRAGDPCAGLSPARTAVGRCRFYRVLCLPLPTASRPRKPKPCYATVPLYR